MVIRCCERILLALLVAVLRILVLGICLFVRSAWWSTMCNSMWLRVNRVLSCSLADGDITDKAGGHLLFCVMHSNEHHAAHLMSAITRRHDSTHAITNHTYNSFRSAFYTFYVRCHNDPPIPSPPMLSHGARRQSPICCHVSSVVTFPLILALQAKKEIEQRVTIVAKRPATATLSALTAIALQCSVSYPSRACANFALHF